MNRYRRHEHVRREGIHGFGIQSGRWKLGVEIANLNQLPGVVFPHPMQLGGHVPMGCS